MSGAGVLYIQAYGSQGDILASSARGDEDEGGNRSFKSECDCNKHTIPYTLPYPIYLQAYTGIIHTGGRGESPCKKVALYNRTVGTCTVPACLHACMHARGRPWSTGRPGGRLDAKCHVPNAGYRVPGTGCRVQQCRSRGFDIKRDHCTQTIDSTTSSPLD